nr:receptor-like protein EIX2 [Tanacetum cinerariifolium]
MMWNSLNVTCIERERESLLKFKERVMDESNRLLTWTGVECCEWVGVQCDWHNGRVFKIDLRTRVSLTDESHFYSGNRLGGEVSSSLVNLKHLRYLDLSMNNFSGDIPEFLGSFKQLEYLNLSHSGFGGVVPHHLGNLSRLQYLDLSYVTSFTNDLRWVSSLLSLKHLDLSGIMIGSDIDWFHPANMLPSLLTLNLAWCTIDIPSIRFVNFTSLNSLDLSYNWINSTIPAWLSNLTDLMHLDIHDNYFHGQIPDFLGTLSALASIDLSYNSFDTSMPDLFWNLSSLVRLDLSFNTFQGAVPPIVKKLCKLSVNLSQNRFVGDLQSLMGHISDCMLNSLKDLNLGVNQFNGSMPNKLGAFKKLERLFLLENGNIPMSLGQLSSLETLDVSNNSLVGTLSEVHFIKLKNLTSLRFSSNSLSLNVSSQWIPPFQLQEFSASSCNVGPHFPNWLQTQSKLLTLDLSNSSIKDTIPDWFENISSHIYYLDLSNNQISGKLPRLQAFSNLKWSGGRYVMVKSNKFEGSVASFPSNVQVLDLSDNLLSGNVPQTNQTMNPDLRIVNLSKNRFTGSSSSLLRELDIFASNIDLSINTITGFLPISLGSLTFLESLHLQNNSVEGSLPLSLQNLTSLVTMDLGNNLFFGSIPFWIGEKLSNLKILNLQSNKFTGTIPLQLCQLNALQLLSLARNNITGMIPHRFGNLTGMITNQVELGHNFYSEESISASMKGSQLQYTKTIELLKSLDLSNNNLLGEIPAVLVNLVALKNLNLSRNLLIGQIPKKIGNLQQVESLDLSMNKLSGQIPLSLATLHALSYLNLSFNKLSGAIPVGNQLQTLDDPSIYVGNIGLCGPPLTRSCKRNDSSFNHVGADEGQDDREGLWFYAGLGPGFVAGFIGLLGSLHFIRIWRLAYFETINSVYGWLKEAWDILAEIFNDNKRSRSVVLKAELCSLKLGDLSVDAYFRKIESIATILASLGSSISKDDIVNIALDGLPEKYDHASDIIIHQEPFPDQKTVWSMLTTAEMRLKSRAQATYVDFTSSSHMVLLANSGYSTFSCCYIKEQMMALIQSQQAFLAQFSLCGNSIVGSNNMVGTNNMVKNKSVNNNTNGNTTSSTPLALQTSPIQPLTGFTSPPGFYSGPTQSGSFTGPSQPVLLRCDSTRDLYPVMKPSIIPHAFLSNANIVICMWLFRHKYLADGTLSRYKARCVANGSMQLKGVDVDEACSPVVKPGTIRTVLSLATSRHWHVHQLDVKNSFLHSDLSETVYMHKPPGFRNYAHPDYVCLLQGSLYGFNQPSWAWFQQFATYITRVGFHHSRCDTSLFIYKQRTDIAYLLLYVDDIRKYVAEILKRTHMTNCNPRRTSIDAESKLRDDVQRVCLYTHDPREPHFLALKRILRYVHEAKYRGVANVVAETCWLRNLVHIDIHFVRDLVVVGQNFIPEECPKNPGLGVMKNLKKPIQSPRGVLFGPKVGFKPAKEYRPISKKHTANTSCNKRKVDYPGDHDSEDEVESVDNDMAHFMASDWAGFGTKSFIEQWRDSYENGDYDEDPYDDDIYEEHNLKIGIGGNLLKVKIKGRHKGKIVRSVAEPFSLSEDLNIKSPKCKQAENTLAPVLRIFKQNLQFSLGCETEIDEGLTKSFIFTTKGDSISMMSGIGGGRLAIRSMDSNDGSGGGLVLRGGKSSKELMYRWDEVGGGVKTSSKGSRFLLRSIAHLLSHSTGMSLSLMSKSTRACFMHNACWHTLPTDTYYASVVEMASAVCLLENHDVRKHPMKVQTPLVLIQST